LRQALFLQPLLLLAGAALAEVSPPGAPTCLGCHSAIRAAPAIPSLRGTALPTPRLLNTCYSLVGPDYGISVGGGYRPANGLCSDIPGAGHTSPLEAPAAIRAAEARYAEDSFATITADAFA
jgi:hypothetical protein